MEPVVLDGLFRLWGYGVGHSQLVLHAPAADGNRDAVSVLFEGVRAMKLRTSYAGLMLRSVDASGRVGLLDYAGVPEFLRHREVCVAMPTEEDGFVVCGKATVLAGKQPGDRAGWRWPEDAVVLHAFPGTEASSAD